MDASRHRGRLSRFLDRHPGLGRTFWLAVLCNLLLEVAGVLGSGRYVWDYKTPAYPLMFLLGSLVMWAVVGVVHALTGRFRVTAVAMLVLTTVVGVIDHEKLRLRREPLLPSDWEFAGTPRFLAAMVGPRLLVTVAVLAALLLTAAVALALRSMRRRSSRPGPDPVVPTDPSGRWRRAAVRGATGVLCLLLLAYLGSFNSSSNLARLTFDALGADWKPWSQQRNYLGNGFVAGFLYNLDVPDMAVPAGYSKAEMARISRRYAGVADRVNAGRDPEALGRTNVVLVLSESFSDPLALRGVHLGVDPIPHVRALVRSDGGEMLTDGIGGGTANMEFEALTGMSLALFPPQMRVPYQMLVPRYAHFPSVVQWMEKTGHRTVALHPFTTEMYRRGDVYRAMGFEQFLHDTTMHAPGRIGHHAYISDASTFAEVHRLIERSADPLFLNVVTMQNHMPYSGRYDDPVPATGPGGDAMPETGQYARGLVHSDDAVAGLLAGLARSPEPTVVVFYGDHLPGSYPSEVLASNSEARLHRTPYFVWANTGRDSVAPPPVVSPTHVVDLALERADAQVSPYFALLGELRGVLPAMDTGLRYDAAGRPLRGELAPRAARLLRDYRLVQYDLSVGRRWSEAAMLAPPGG